MSESDGIRPEPPQQRPAGWYEDQTEPGQQRWWSGDAWTEHVRPKPQAAPPTDGNDSEADLGGAGTNTSALAHPITTRKRPWLIPSAIALGAVVVVAVGTILAITITNAVSASQEEARELAAAEAAAEAEAARLELLPDAVKSCGLASSLVQDGGTSMFLDNEGDDFASGDLSTAELVCVLNAIDTPDAVINHMSNTRSLDGTQSDTWGDFSATWTYHPDDGLDIIVKLVK